MLKTKKQTETQPLRSNLLSQLLHHREKQFTGRIDVSVSDEEKWRIYFNLGRLVWATGGACPHRRWGRLMSQYCPQVSWEQLQEPRKEGQECGEYQILTFLAKQKIVTLEQLATVIKAAVTEVLFDILQKVEQASLGKAALRQDIHLAALPKLASWAKQAESIKIEHFSGVRPSQESILPPSCLLPVETITNQTMVAWENWVRAGLTYFSPNLVPTLKKTTLLQQQTSPRAYQNLLTLVDGERSLRDITLLTKKKNIVQLTGSLLPYIDQEAMSLAPAKDVRDIHAYQLNISRKRALIACVDDNPRVCALMQELVEEAGYRFLAIQDDVQALSTLLEHKPDLIFLDLVMPVMNGYEICAHLRRIPNFANTPIIILSGHDTIVERMRAKLVGATEFFSKPIDSLKLHNLLQKHLVAQKNSAFVSKIER